MAVIAAADFSSSFAEDHTVSAGSPRNAVLLNACGLGCRFVLVDKALTFSPFLPRASGRMLHNGFFIQVEILFFVERITLCSL